MTEKFCFHCKTTKPATDFTKSRFTKTGLACWCRDCSKASNDAWRKANPEKIKQLGREKWKNTTQAQRDAHAARCREEYARVKKEIVEQYGGRCACCGETILAFLTIDHVNGDGAHERRQNKGKTGIEFYRWIKRQGYPEKYQVLCFNCNSGKGTRAICPHDLIDDRTLIGACG